MRKTILSAVSLMNVRSEKQSSSLASQRLLVQMALLVFFFETYWKTICISVILFVHNFFRNGFLLKEFNHTHLALIPKIDNPFKKTQVLLTFLIRLSPRYWLTSLGLCFIKLFFQINLHFSKVGLSRIILYLLMSYSIL
jgi:hypothetical protein